MPANTPNIGAINAIGNQFTNDVAGKLKTHLKTTATKSQTKHVERIRQDTAARNEYAAGVNQAIQDSQKQATAHAKAQKAAQGAASKAAKSQAAAVKTGRTAPAQGAPPRTFAVPSSPAQKPVQEAGQSAKASGKVAATKPGPSKTGTTAMAGPQFADKTSQDNSPHPTAHFPEGASKQVLPHLSESLSEPGRPQTFTQGAYTMKPGGIAARGSQLEGWAQTKTRAVQARQASKRAGGRDRNLAAAAREWENAANKPMNLEG